MMSKYHVGTLDAAAIQGLRNEPQKKSDQETRNVLLQSRYWTRAELCKKQIVSQDSRLFTFVLEHDHLMLKIADPLSAKNHIIRTYTPISQTDRPGTMELLVKIYFKTPDSECWKMTMALENLATQIIGLTLKDPLGSLCTSERERLQ
jgi:nitrate reductase (NAD(P)H)